MLNEMLTSKKFWITCLGMVCTTVALIVGSITAEMWVGVISGLCGLYAIGQGIADSKK